MLVEVRHFFPGRIRLYVPGLFANGDAGHTIESLVPAGSFQTFWPI